MTLRMAATITLLDGNTPATFIINRLSGARSPSGRACDLQRPVLRRTETSRRSSHEPTNTALIPL